MGGLFCNTNLLKMGREKNFFLNFMNFASLPPTPNPTLSLPLHLPPSPPSLPQPSPLPLQTEMK